MPQPQKDEGDAVIVGIIGDWQIEGRADRLKFLSSIDVGNGICVNGTDGYLAVQFGDQVSPFPCDRQTDGPCNSSSARKKQKTSDRPFVCTRQIARPSDAHIWQGLIAAVAPLLRASPERFVGPVSRGLEAELSDTVVPLRDGSADFASALADMDASSYTLRLEPLDGSSRTPVNAAVNWRGSGGAPAKLAGLTPGLYRVTRVGASGTRTGEDAWVLVCSPERFEKRSAEFSRAVEATKKWPTEVDVRAPRAVLRAYLQALSSEP